MCRGGHTSSRSAYSRTSQSFQIRRFVSSVCSVAAPLGAGRGEGVLLMRVEECVCVSVWFFLALTERIARYLITIPAACASDPA